MTCNMWLQRGGQQTCVSHPSHLTLQTPKGFPQSKHWLASLFSVESHRSQQVHFQKIAQPAPDRAPVSLCVWVCNPYDSALAQIAETMNNSLAEIQAGCGLTLCCRFSPKGGMVVWLSITVAGALQSEIVCVSSMLCLHAWLVFMFFCNNHHTDEKCLLLIGFLLSVVSYCWWHLWWAETF